MACCNKKNLILIGAIIIVSVAYAIISINKPSQKIAQTPSKTQTHSTQVNGVGTLEAKEIITISPKHASKISTVYADEGETVSKGAHLAQMELSELTGIQTQNSAAIDKSRAQVASQKALIEDLKGKQTLADATLKRYTNLIKGGFVTQAEFDSVQASAKSASFALVSAQEALKLSEHEVKRTIGSLDSVNATINDYSLRSPIDGIIISREAEAGSTIGAGTAVFKIANPKTLWVRTYIDERQSGTLQVGQKAVVTLRSTGEQKYAGVVSRIGVMSDRITEERVVYITLDHLPIPFSLGEQAEVQINVTHD